MPMPPNSGAPVPILPWKRAASCEAWPPSLIAKRAAVLAGQRARSSSPSCRGTCTSSRRDRPPAGSGCCRPRRRRACRPAPHSLKPAPIGAPGVARPRRQGRGRRRRRRFATQRRRGGSAAADRSRRAGRRAWLLRRWRFQTTTHRQGQRQRHRRAKRRLHGRSSFGGLEPDDRGDLDRVPVAGGTCHHRPAGCTGTWPRTRPRCS